MLPSLIFIMFISFYADPLIKMCCSFSALKYQHQQLEILFCCELIIINYFLNDLLCDV